MKNIVIGTDFSAAAKNAFKYGVRLAEHLQATVTLVHTFKIFDRAIGSVPSISSEAIGEIKEDVALQLLTEQQSLPFKTDVNVNTRAIEGDTIEGLLDVANELADSLIVAGMKSSDKAFKKIFGSTTMALARKCARPMIVVPETLKFMPFATLALATDINDSTNMHLFNPMIALGEKFNATAYLVRVIRRKKDELVELLFRPSSLQWYLQSLHPSLEFINDHNVAHALNEFVEKHDVNLLCMMSQEHNFFERLVQKSNIREVLFSANVPILILPGHSDTTA